MSKISDDTRIQKTIAERKVITIDVLTSLLNSSIKTARRRLKLWEAYTSYNENGRIPYLVFQNSMPMDYGPIDQFGFQNMATSDRQQSI